MDHLVVLHDLNLAAPGLPSADRAGRLQTFGPARVLDAALIERLYQVPVEISHDQRGIPSSEPCEDVATQCCATPATTSPTHWWGATMNGASWRDWQGYGARPPACSSSQWARLLASAS